MLYGFVFPCRENILYDFEHVVRLLFPEKRIDDEEGRYLDIDTKILQEQLLIILGWPWDLV